MSKHDELESLQKQALTIAALEDRHSRHEGGYRLEAQCRSLDDQYRIINGLDTEAEISLRAVLKIVFEYILHDAIEDPDEDVGVAMGLDERGDLEQIAQIMKGS